MCPKKLSCGALSQQLANLNEFKACVVGALIAIDQGFCLQRNTMDFDQPIHCIKDEINF